MKRKFLNFAFLMGFMFVFSLNVTSQEASIINAQSTQNTYKRIQINNINEATIHKLNELGVDLTCGAIFENQQLTVELHDAQLEFLGTQNINYNIIINDMQKFYSERAITDLPLAKAKLQQEKSLSTQKSFSVNELINNVGQYNECDEIDWAVPANWNLNPNSSPNSFGGCLTYDMVLQELDDMRTLYPNLISLKTNASPTNQLTVEGRTVYYVRISDNPDIDEASEPETLYQSLIHARESATVMNQLYFMWYLLENYNTDTAIKNLIDNQAMYFIPVFNPDGFVYNQTVAPNGGGGQRKNRNTSAPGSCSTYLDGIDLNRNSAYYWGNGGSSTNSCSDTYLGTAPFSENETQIMRDFFLQHDFELALNHHSFKNAMLHAYAGTNITNPRPDEYSKYNHDMTFYNRYAHGPSTSISSLNSGNMNDWMLGGPAGVSANNTPTGTGSGKNTMAWTPENGTSGEGGFWPAPSNFLPIAKRAMRMNFLAAYFSGKYAKLHDLNQSDITITSGNLKFAIERLGQTDGDFTLTVIPVSSNIVSVGGPSIQSGMSILQQNNIDISYTLDPTIQANDEIEFKVVLTNDYASGNVLYEANIVKQYNPTIIFADNPDTDNLANWTTSGGTWSVTSDAFSGNSAITSTASAPYANNVSKQIQMNGSVDLSGAGTTLVQYFAKWDLERSFDYVQIEGSTNGTNWTPLCGKLNKPGAPNVNNTYSGKSSANNNFQPDGEKLYDGDTQDKWNMEEIVIDASTNSFLFNQSTVFLRFDFKTDGTNREDSYVNVDFEGFTFDDFKIITLLAPCTALVPTNLTANSITSSGALINWDIVSGVEYDLRYKESVNSTWEAIIPLTNNSFSLSNLLSSTEYEVQVRSRCTNGSTTDYSTSLLFTTDQNQTPGNSVFYEQTPGDSRQYIEYIPGNLPIIISAPHGGVKQSGETIGGVFYPDDDSTLTDRNCGTNERDDNTEILVREIQEEIFNLTGCYAHVIINNLHRSKLDPNREINEATCGDQDAIDHWNAWHDFIDQASTSVEANWGKGLYIDLHGQSHSIPRIEIGYNISGAQLNSSDLNGSNIVNNSTIKNLIASNIGSLSSEQLIRGNESLGAKFKSVDALFYNNNVNAQCGVTSGYRAIPSNFDSGASDDCDDTRPFSSPYFDGDFYNNRRHGSGPTASDGSGGGGTIDGIMTEVNRRVRDLGTYNGNVYDTRPQTLVPFAKDYAAVVLDYIDTHYNDFADFNYSASVYSISDPNPTPTLSSAVGGVFSSTPGLAINSVTGEIDLANCIVGNYTITCSVGDCGFYQETRDVEIIDGSDTENPTVPVLAASGTTETTTDLSWTVSTDNVGVVNYDIYQDSNLIATINATSFQVTNLLANTTYEFNIRAKDAVGNESDFSNLVTITTLDAPLIYCTSSSTNVNDEFISNVQLNTINNSSGAQFYTDFTAISTTLTKGEQYTISVTPTWTGTVYNEAYSVWIDYNRDGDFEDSGEQVWTQGITQATQVSGNFTIPLTAIENSTRMRVSMKYNDIPDPCETFTWGEVEDYTVIIEPDAPDTTIPVINLIGQSNIDLDVGGVYSEQGATATDNIDGDISGSIVIAGDVVNTALAGSYVVTYNVSDAAGNSAVEVIRTVNVIPDTTIPVITLIGSSIIDLDIGGIYTEQGATATDNIDGDISGNIVIAGDVVNTASAGVYVVTYNVSDAAGNPAAEVTRTVTVIPDTTIPVITLIGSSIIDLDVGGVYSEQGATATDNIDGDISGSIVIAGDVVNTALAGVYVVTYNVSDAAGNSAVEVTRIVNVIPDTVAPIITLIGSSVINLDIGGIYTEQGATATDNIDGDISGSIIIAGDVVNTALAGVYVVTYNVSDAAGNLAIEVTRLVNVNPISSGCSGGVNTFPYSEGFENTLGAWTQSSNDDLNWTIDANGTPSNNTGPSTAIEGNFYIYVEASGNGTGFPNKSAILESPCFDLTALNQATFSFSYHMFGSNDMGKIELELTQDDGLSWITIWQESGNKGNSWQTVNLDLSAFTGNGVQMRFNRVTGGTWQADIAIDNLSLTEGAPVINQCSGGITAYPYSEGFENTIGTWTQSSSDDLDWTVDANGTPSNNTGPSSAIEGNDYIYVEASGNGTGFPNKQAIITSPCFDLTNESYATFEFNYHMFGATNAGTIELQVSNNAGDSWITVWTESGNNGDAWNTQLIDLNTYLGDSIQLRFNRVTGNTWQADVAIDGINLNTVPPPTFNQEIVDKQLLNTRVELYPNPVRRILSIGLLNIKAERYEVLNTIGQIVLKGRFTKTVDVSKLDNGTYMLKLYTKHSIETKRFIKN